jgi:hypothetical protein
MRIAPEGKQIAHSDLQRPVQPALLRRIGSEPASQHKHEQDDEQDSDDANAAIAEAIAVTAEAPTEAAKEENYQYDEQYGAE